MNAMSEIDQSPHSIELEQQILGALMGNNDLAGKVANLKAEHFYDPVHADIFSNVMARIARDHLASPVTVATDFAMHAGLQDLGGAKYLAKLVGASISSFAVADYARELEGLWQRRTLADALYEARNGVLASPDPEVAKSAVEAILGALPESEGRESSLSMTKAVTQTFQSINDAYHGEFQGVSTGFVDLDKRLAGFFPANLILLAGRPSMGKTALGLAFAVNAARAGKKVAIWSLEMSASELTERVVGAAARVDYEKYRRGTITEAEFRKTGEVVREIHNLPMQIIPDHIRDIPAGYSAIKSVKKALGGLDFVLVDYLQLIRSKGINANERVSEVSAQLKGIAKMLGAPVVALSQLSRAVESRDDKHPILSDLRDSGSLEQDADVVLFCYRHEYYLSRQTPPDSAEKRADWEAELSACRGKMEVITAKQRMGPIGVDLIGAHMPTNRFWDLSTEEGFL